MFHMQPHDILQKIVSKKSQKAIRLISHLQIGEYEDIESLYSEQSEPDEETEFTLNQTDSSDEESSAPPIPIFSLQEEQYIKPAIPQPCVEIQVLAKKFEKPIINMPSSTKFCSTLFFLLNFHILVVLCEHRM